MRAGHSRRGLIDELQTDMMQRVDLASSIRVVERRPSSDGLAIDLSDTSRLMYARTRSRRYWATIPGTIVTAFFTGGVLYATWIKLGFANLSWAWAHYGSPFVVLLIAIDAAMVAGWYFPAWLWLTLGPGPTRLECDHEGLSVTLPSGRSVTHSWKSPKTRVVLNNPVDRTLTGDPEMRVEVHLKDCYQLNLTPSLADRLAEAAQGFGAAVTRRQTSDFWLGRITQITIKGKP